MCVFDKDQWLKTMETVKAFPRSGKKLSKSPSGPCIRLTECTEIDHNFTWHADCLRLIPYRDILPNQANSSSLCGTQQICWSFLTSLLNILVPCMASVTPSECAWPNWNRFFPTCICVSVLSSFPYHSSEVSRRKLLWMHGGHACLGFSHPSWEFCLRWVRCVQFPLCKSLPEYPLIVPWQ